MAVFSVKKITYSKHAAKTLKHMPAADAKRIKTKLNQYAANPDSLVNNVKKLQGLDYFRLRVGDWRVIFGEDGVVINVVKIAVRGDVYKGVEP